MNEDAAHDCLADLGKLAAIQFTDVSSDASNSSGPLHSLDPVNSSG